MKRLMVIMAAFTVMLLLGCSTTSTIKAHPDYSGNTPVIAVIDKTETISVFVSGKAEDKEEIDLLRTELINQFRQKGFVTTESNPTATVKVEITNIRRVSRGTRMLLGVFAGKAIVNVEVRITKNDKTISTFGLETEAISFTGWCPLPGTTSQAISKAAERLVQLMSG